MSDYRLMLHREKVKSDPCRFPLLYFDGIALLLSASKNPGADFGPRCLCSKLFRDLPSCRMPAVYSLFCKSECLYFMCVFMYRGKAMSTKLPPEVVITLPVKLLSINRGVHQL